MAQYKNPPDYFMRLLAISYPKTDADKKLIEFFVNKYKEVNETKMFKEREKIQLEQLSISSKHH